MKWGFFTAAPFPIFSSVLCKYSEPALVDISIWLSAALPLIRKDSCTASFKLQACFSDIFRAPFHQDSPGFWSTWAFKQILCGCSTQRTGVTLSSFPAWELWLLWLLLAQLWKRWFIFMVHKNTSGEISLFLSPFGITTLQYTLDLKTNMAWKIIPLDFPTHTFCCTQWLHSQL